MAGALSTLCQAGSRRQCLRTGVMLPTIRTIRPLIHERRNENDRIDPIGAAEHRRLRYREFTQEVAPTRAKAR